MGKIPNKKKYKIAKSTYVLESDEMNNNTDSLTQASSRSSDVLPVINQVHIILHYQKASLAQFAQLNFFNVNLIVIFN